MNACFCWNIILRLRADSLIIFFLFSLGVRMFKKHFLITLLFAGACLRAADIVGEDAEFKSSGCKKFKNLNVCNALNVGGNETVTGSVTAASFATPLGTLVSGFRNYAVLTNQAAIAESVSGETVLWGATAAGDLSADISVDTSTGAITLPTSGTFFIEYSVRLDRYPPNGDPGTSLAIAQLQQTIAGTSTDISQPAITNNLDVDEITSGQTVPASERQITGYALIQVTSAANKVLDLVVTVTNNASVPATSGTDANAQMLILQIN